VSDLPAIRQELDELAAMLAAAEHLIDDGHVIEIPPIEERVDALCARILALEPRDRQACGAILSDLIRGLEALLAKLRHGLDALERSRAARPA
jgi:hypothetical protein